MSDMGSAKTLSNRVARELRITKNEAKVIVKVVLDAMIDELAEYGLLQLKNYFSFKVVERKGSSFGKEWSKKHIKVSVSEQVKNRFN